MHAIQKLTILAIALVAGMSESTSAHSHAIFPKAHAQRAAPNRIDASTFNASKRAMRLGLAANPNVHTEPDTRVRKVRKNTADAVSAQQEERRAFDPFAPSEHVLEMRKIELKRDASVHPIMYYQQHANRAIARLAHMSGQQDAVEAHDEQLEANLRKRWQSLELPPFDLKIRKRSTVKTQLLKKRQRVKQRQDDRNRQMPAIGNSAATNNVSVSGNTASGTNTGGGPGFSQAELTALTQNTQTDGPEDVDNTLGLDIQANDNSYYATLKIGTPGKDFKILIDSGSADFWVPSTNCPTCGPHQALGSSTSSSLRTSRTAFRVVYGSGEVDGTIVQDTVVLGNLTLRNHTFGVTTVASQQFGAASTLFDGLMGTAISGLSNQRVLTPIEALAKQGAVKAATMGYAIGRVSDGVNVGTVTFGGVNADQVANSRLVEVPNISKVGFWEAAVGNVGVNGNFLNMTGRTAILDTGTTLALIPPADARAIHAAIPGSRAGANGLFTVPCDTTATVAFSFGGQLFNIEPEDLLFQPVDPNNLNGQCISAIMGQAIGGSTQYLLGDSFLKGKYFATNVEQNVIGLAQQA